MPIERMQGLDDISKGFDELVATEAAVHIERMANDHIWMAVTAGDKRVTLNLHIRKRSIWATVDMDDVPSDNSDAVQKL